MLNHTLGEAEEVLAPRSPDPNLLVFFLRGFPKDNIDQVDPLTIVILKAAITEKIKAIIQEECVRFINKFVCRIQQCL